jgi:hypothetical protein
LIRIPDPEDPLATYVNCPICNASSYTEAEKRAFELCNEDIDYRKATQHRMKLIQQQVPLQLEGFDNPQIHETLAQTEIQLIESGIKSSSIEPFTLKIK